MSGRVFFALILLSVFGSCALHAQAEKALYRAAEQWGREDSTRTMRFYQRSSLEWHQIPFHIPAISGRFIPGEKDLGLSYLEERTGRIYLFGRQHLEEVDSVSTAGTLRHFQWMAVRDILWASGERYITIPELSTAPLFSPLSRANARLYAFEQASDADSTVYFRPSARNFHGLRGSFQKRDNGWELRWYLEREQGLRLADSVNYLFIMEAGAPREIRFTAHFSTLEFQATYRSHVILYPDSIPLSSNWPTHCLLRWSTSSDTTISSAKTRPIPLNEDEKHVIKEELHFQERKKSQAYRDSVRAFERKYLFVSSLLTGGEIRTTSHSRIDLHPIWKGLGINTVEGIYYVARPVWELRRDGQELKVYSDLRYAFGANDFRWKAGITYAQDNRSRIRYRLEGGHYLSQFNKLEPIQPIWNSVYTVFFGDNFLKMFERDYIAGQIEWEPVVGLTVRTTLEYARRRPLFNLSAFEGERDYTPNNPLYPGVINPTIGFSPHNATTFSFDFSYQFGQKYRIRRGQRIDEHSNLPKVYAEYRKGLPILNGVTDFDFLTLGLGAETDWGSWGFSKADLSGGSFLQQERVEFMDFKHFNGIQTLFLQSTLDPWSSIRQFATLPYYDYSTSRGFLEFHLDHDFRGSLWKELPWIGHLNWSFIGGANYLYTNEYGHFTEVFVGLDRIFGLFRTQFMIPIPRPENARSSIRFGMTIQYDFYRQNRRR